MGGGSETGSLQETPTWALATVCFVFIALGIFVEYLIHLAGDWLKKHKKVALFEATKKLKSVLMLLGFMSLLLTATQRSISKICIPKRAVYSMLPCRKIPDMKTTHALSQHLGVRQITFVSHEGRVLASSPSNPTDHCSSKGMASFMSQEGLNQLNIFIFVLAAMQIVYTMATMALGRAKLLELNISNDAMHIGSQRKRPLCIITKMKRWKAWEKETQTIEYMAANDPYRFRFTRQTTFGRRHTNSCATNPAQLWIKCFFQQFWHSVAKTDYLTLRHGFISAHIPENVSFNFQEYIERSLDDDFRAVVGISPIMWYIVVLFLLVDVHGWNALLWISFIPLAIVLLVGTKLEVIMEKMATQLTNANEVIRGSPLVHPDSRLFWFNRPQLILTALHFTLFMNAFEFAFFIWTLWQYGINSCYLEKVEIVVTRVVLAVIVQVLCSYRTLPLYALVTQMGSEYKSSILKEDTVRAMKQWHAEVKHKRKHIEKTAGSSGGIEMIESSVRSANQFLSGDHDQGMIVPDRDDQEHELHTRVGRHVIDVQ